ncbi:MAG: DNA mismatch repair protein MutL, partial [Lachnospiraceae bacterium]|nr:DNA mismatch repair protein MutL [Lachnospiraceae bacterium]
MDNFTKIGFKIEDFGGNDVIISEIPFNMYGINSKELFLSMIDSLDEFSGKETAEVVLDKIAMMSCKAAVKGNSKLSIEEANAIIDELLELENPYHCPHGRPTIIELTKSELERRFKR